MPAPGSTSNLDLEGELHEYAVQVESQKEEVAALLRDLSDEQFHWRPAESKWSIGEHVAHLPRTARPYLAAIEIAVAQARAKGIVGMGPFRHGWLGNWFARSMEPPVKVRMKAPEQIQPQRSEPKDQVLAEFLAAQDEVLAALRGSVGIDLGRARLRSPFLPILKLSVGQAFRATIVHNRRHLWHIRQILADPGWPQPGA